jgi:hypothetical protein
MFMFTVQACVTETARDGPIVVFGTARCVLFLRQKAVGPLRTGMQTISNHEEKATLQICINQHVGRGTRLLKSALLLQQVAPATQAKSIGTSVALRSVATPVIIIIIIIIDVRIPYHLASTNDTTLSPMHVGGEISFGNDVTKTRQKYTKR